MQEFAAEEAARLSIRPCLVALTVALAILFVSGCGGPPGLVSVPTATVSPVATPSPTLAPSPPTRNRVGCQDGRLLIGDLPQMDRQWRAGIDAATAKATKWQPDAYLTSLKVGCQLFEPGFRWQATFYSPKAQAFYSSDTGGTQPAEVDPQSVATLRVEGLSFGLLRRSLAKSGYDDETEISPSSGVDLRMNTNTQPFGPPAAPKDELLFHVSIERLGEVKDLFVSGNDGAIYRYSI